MMVYVYHHGAQKPPLFCEATGGSNTMIDHQFRRQHKGMYYFPIRYSPDPGFATTKQYEINTCSGTWVPGSIKHEVAEDELAQIWQEALQVPPTREGLTIIVTPAPTSAWGTADIRVQPEFSLEYTVQLKDLKRDFQYPTQKTAVPAISNAPAQGN